MVLSISDRRKVICGRGQSELFGVKNFATGQPSNFGSDVIIIMLQSDI